MADRPGYAVSRPRAISQNLQIVFYRTCCRASVPWTLAALAERIDPSNGRPVSAVGPFRAESRAINATQVLSCDRGRRRL